MNATMNGTRWDVVNGIVRQLNVGIWASLDEVWALRPDLTTEERNAIVMRCPEDYLG